LSLGRSEFFGEDDDWDDDDEDDWDDDDEDDRDDEEEEKIIN